MVPWASLELQRFGRWRWEWRPDFRQLPEPLWHDPLWRRRTLQPILWKFRERRCVRTQSLQYIEHRDYADVFAESLHLWAGSDLYLGGHPGATGWRNRFVPVSDRSEVLLTRERNVAWRLG